MKRLLLLMLTVSLCACSTSSGVLSKPDTLLMGSITCEIFLFTPLRKLKRRSKPERDGIVQSSDTLTAHLEWADSETLLLMECNDSITNFYLLNADDMQLKAAYRWRRHIRFREKTRTLFLRIAKAVLTP